jgi:hypothetical protein
VNLITKEQVMKRKNIPHILAAISMAGAGASSQSFPFHPVPPSPP